MVERRGLLDTGKELGSSVAGTFRSAAGTLKEAGESGASRARSAAGTLSQTGRQAASATASGVRDRYEDLTDDTVTDQEQARLERAREEALQEARQEARQEFQEEYQENLFDEAYDMELTQLKRQNPNVESRSRRGRSSRKRKISRQVDERLEEQQQQPVGGGMGMGFFGVPQSRREPVEDDDTGDERPPRQPANLGLFGVPQQPPPQEQQQEETTQQQPMQRDPLFGFPL